MKKSAFVKTLLLSIMIFTLSLTGFSKARTILSKWVIYQLNIDGNQIDWRDQTLDSEKRLSIDYAFKNDGENLFAIFIFKDPRYLSTISGTGMTIWFNTEEKKKKDYGIKFTKKKVPAEAFIAYLEQSRGPLPEEEKNEIRSKRNYFLHKAEVVGKKSKSSGQVYDKGEIKPAVFRAVRQREITVYEFAIPLKRVAEKAPGIGTEPGKIIKVGFEWGGITDEMKAAKIKRAQDASGDRPGQPGVTFDKFQKSIGQSMPGRGPKKYTLWMDIQLAKKQ